MKPIGVDGQRAAREAHRVPDNAQTPTKSEATKDAKATKTVGGEPRAADAMVREASPKAADGKDGGGSAAVKSAASSWKGVVTRVAGGEVVLAKARDATTSSFQTIHKAAQTPRPSEGSQGPAKAGG